MSAPATPSGSPSDWETGPGIPEYVRQETFEAAWYLTSSRIWPLVRHPIAGPFMLGIVIAAIIVAAVVLSPSTESRFIYTDF